MAANVNEKNCVADINSAWDVITGLLTPKHEISSLDHSNEELHDAYQVLEDNQLGHIVQEWFLECLQEDLRQRIAPGFWKHFDSSIVDARQLVTAVDFLHENISRYSSCFSKLEFLFSEDDSRWTECFGQKKIGDLVITLYKAIIFHVMSKHFLDVVDHFYSDAFKVFHHCNSEGAEGYSLDDSHNWNSCPGCGGELSACTCQEIMENFHSVNRKLDAMGLLERVSGLAVTSTVNDRIKHHIESTCKGNFETSYLEPLERWLDNKVLGWLNLVYAGNRTHIDPDCISNFRGRLLHFLYETLADTQIGQLFPIIIDFPDSEPAILDLKVCLEKTDKRSHLIPSFKNALETRLLHPGVNTADILTAYISAIRTLRVLDPAGVILELVCEPVRKYLRMREDTVRCIVSSLTDEGSNELSDELIKGEPLVLDESYHSDDEQCSWQNWMPDPVDADPATTSKSRRSSDIISMLVNIYGSKELFVNEYRTLLADRILTQFNYDTEKEIRYLELLKLRFGEAQLHYCEVMLKDVADSKRINAGVAEERKKEGSEEQDFHVNAMILSAQFWPTFRDEKITVPSNMEKSLEEFTKKYEALKGNRTLAWKNHLGLMNIDVELKDRTLNFNVSPVHAAIIMQFQEKDTWTVEELSSVLQMPATALSRKLSYWQSQGLLKEETPDTFVLIEEHKGRSQETIVADEDETESAMASSHVQREEELQVFWSFIVGMLTNLESLPLPRIHSMLRMFAMQGPTAVECSVPELKAFLDRKVKEQKLVYTGGVYRLAK